MENKEELPEFSLEDILKEFQDAPTESPAENTGNLEELLKTLVGEPTEPDIPPAEAAAEPEAPAAPQAPETVPEAEEAAAEVQEPAPEAADEALPEAVHLPEEAAQQTEDILPELGLKSEDDEIEAVAAENTPSVAEAAAEAEAEEAPQPAPIPLSRSAKLRELKRKLVAGPEKRYYDLSEQGVLKLQIGIIINIVIFALCVVSTTMNTLGSIPENRMKLLIFSQVLAMLVSGLLGCHLMLDGLGDLLRFRYTPNTTLAITFAACCADALFCLKELRVPCCSAFTLEMVMAMFAVYQRRSTEMAQMDTLRKASQLISLVKEPGYYEKRTGILRGTGDVEDFMDSYRKSSGPEKVQCLFAFVSLILCIGIAALTYMLHSVSMAVQIFSTSLLVALPASYFIALTRPAYILEKRLHMVGTVICGWRGVKKLCGRAVFPVYDLDLFPKSSTKLNGIKFYTDRAPEEIVSYTASLIAAAGGGLVTVFRKLLASRNGTEYPVENFHDYGHGGVGGEIQGEPVLLGSLSFLQDMGVEIPQGTMVNQAIYVAIDGQLSAVIAITYAKMRSSAAGMVSLCGCRKLRVLLMPDDFILTEDFIRSKFSIRTRRLIAPPRELRSELLRRKADPEADVLALVTREELVANAYAITGSMALRTACIVGSLIHILGGLIGAAIMLALAYLGSTELLTPTHVLLYQLVWLVPGFLATEWTRSV